MLGGFTTMSAVALESGELLDDGAWLMVAAYLGATLLAGLAGVMVGERLAARAHVGRAGGGRR
jgi:fluoride ion exporter CrcB/FEX